MQGVGSFHSFSAQSDSATQFSWCTPWQCCRTYGLDFPTSSIITGMRGAAGGRQPAAAKPACNMILPVLVSPCMVTGTARTTDQAKISIRRSIRIEGCCTDLAPASSTTWLEVYLTFNTNPDRTPNPDRLWEISLRRKM